MLRAAPVLICVSAALLGCPAQSNSNPTASQDGGLTPDTAASAEASTRLCDAHLAWDMGCAAMEPEPRSEPFWGATECLMGPWRYVQARYLDAAVECFASLDCEQSDDACTGAALAALGIDDDADLADDALFQRCVELAADCDALIEDACLFFAVYTQDGRSKAEGCLELECDAIESCLLDPQ